MIKLKSNRINKEFEAEIYEKDGSLIIKHTSLENIYWSMDDEIRPSFKMQVMELEHLPGIPPMFAVKGIMSSEEGGVVVESIGELLCEDWQYSNPIKRSFPLTSCRNMAFDRCLIRYMQFHVDSHEVGMFYSSSEISLDGSICLSDKNIISKDVISSEIKEEALDPNANYPFSEDTFEIAPTVVDNHQAPEYKKTSNITEIPSVENPPKLALETDSQCNRNHEIPSGIEDNAEIPLSIPDFYTGSGFTSTNTPVSIYQDQTASVETPVIKESLVENQPTINWFDQGAPTMPTFPDPVQAGEPFMDDTIQNFQTNMSPFPWNNIQEAAGTNMPIPPEMPPVTGAPIQGWGQNTGSTIQPGYVSGKRNVSIFRVRYDLSIGKSIITTDVGDLYYDPCNGKWTSSDIDPSSIDLDDLYNKASEHIHEPLNRFMGTLLP